jgi:hypothetical protein
MEIEADRVEMLLLSVAGFDPYIAVEVEEKRSEEIQGVFGLKPRAAQPNNWR